MIMILLSILMIGIALGLVFSVIFLLVLQFGKADQHELPTNISHSPSPTPPTDPQEWEKYFPCKPERCNGQCKITDGFLINCSECGADNY